MKYQINHISQSNVIKLGRLDSQETEIDTTLMKSLELSQLN